MELNHTDPSVLPAGFRTDSNDSRILACALNLAAEGRDVVLVTKDTPLRVKAGAVGLPAEEYHAQDVVNSGWTGMAELAVATEADRRAVLRRPHRPRRGAGPAVPHRGPAAGRDAERARDG